VFCSCLQASREIDLPMLQQLAPLGGARVKDWAAEACDANVSRGKRVSAAADTNTPIRQLSKGRLCGWWKAHASCPTCRAGAV
jgi:hypothetical protein